MLAVTIWPASQLGVEFMPTLNEGTLLYMPSSLPGMSVTKAAELMQTQNKIIKSFPEVASVYGKAGRAATATDPAPLEMFETVINLKPEAEWRAGMTIDKLVVGAGSCAAVSGRLERMDDADPRAHRHAVDGHSHADRHQGLRQGPERDGAAREGDRERGEERARHDAARSPSASPAASTSTSSRTAAPLARYGLTVGEVQDVIATALGGEMVTTTVEGRERFGVIVRYPRELRSDPQKIAHEVLVPTMNRRHDPLGQVARIEIVKGAPGDPHRKRAALRVHLRRHPGPRHRRSYVADGAEGGDGPCAVSCPAITSTWSGQFEYMQRAIEQAEDRRPADAADHIRAALPELQASDRNADRHAVGAVRAGRRRMADVVAGLQHERRRGGRLSSRWPASPPKPAW